MDMSVFLLRRTWKPQALGFVLVFGEEPSESRRDMKRFSAPNMPTRLKLEAVVQASPIFQLKNGALGVMTCDWRL